MSQRRLAEVVGISTSYLSKIERACTRGIALRTLADIADGLGVPVQALFAEQNEIG